MFNHNNFSASMDPHQRRRVLFAVAGGIAAGVVAALASSYVNIWLFPDLPLYFDNSRFFVALAAWMLVGGTISGIAGMSSEGWRGIFLSSALLSLGVLLYSFMQSSVSTSLKVIGLIVLLVPFGAMISPLALAFFWLARRFVEASLITGWRRWQTLVVNLIVIAALGALPALYTKFSADAETGVRIVHGMLQDASRVAAREQLHKALLKTEGVFERRAAAYRLSQTRSASSTVGVDVTAHYADGYRLTCTVILYPGSAPYIEPCQSAQP